MKRLLAIGTTGFIVAAFICIECERKTSLICFAVLSLILLFSIIGAYFYKHIFFGVSVILTFTVLSFLLFLFFHSPRIENVHSYDGYKGKLTAQITRLYTNDYYSELTVNRVKIGDKTINSNVLVSLSEGTLEYKEGDYIILDGKLHTEFLSLFNSDEERYLASQNVFLLMDADSIEKADVKPNAFRNFIFDYKNKATSQTDLLEHGGFVTALALGDKSKLDAEIQADFQKLGLQHALAVSGMHLSLLVMNLYVFFQHYSFGKYPLSVICSIITLFYMALTGFTFSILRAGIMMIIYFISLLVRRLNDSITTLFASALLILIHNPWSLFDIGFQLSFFATLGILVLAKPMIEKIEEHSFFSKKLPQKIFSRFLTKIIRRCIKAVLVTFCVSISASLTTIPLILVYFNSIAPLSIIANVTVIFLINAVLVVSVIYIVLAPVMFVSLKMLGIFICDSLSSITLSLTGFLADILPNPLYFSPEVSEVIAYVCSLVILLFFVFYRNHKTSLYAALTYIIAITLTLGCVNIANKNTAYITFSTSPSCSDTLIETVEGKTLLSHVKKNSTMASMKKIIDYRKAYSLNSVVIFFDGASPLEKVKAILEQSQINKLILVQLNGGFGSKDRKELSTLCEVEYVKANEFELNEIVSIRKYGNSYITVSVKQGENDTVIVYSQDGRSAPPRSRLEDVEGVVILGAVEGCPRYYEKVFYLCSLPEKLIKRKDTSNSGKFNFGFIKLSDKTIKYNIY